MTPVLQRLFAPVDHFDVAGFRVAAPGDCDSDGTPNAQEIDECTGDLACADCNGNSVPDGCDLAAGEPDNNGNDIPDSCECCTPAAPRDVKIPDSVGGNPMTTLTTNQTLIFQAGGDDGCTAQAIRVTFVDLDPPYDRRNGERLWLGKPVLTGEAGRSANPTGGPTDKFWAELQCTPECRSDWGSLGDIHAFHEGIVPNSVYDVEIVDCSNVDCMADDSVFSAPLPLTTSAFGDVLRDCSTTPCSPPEGTPVNVSDALGVLAAFSSALDAPRNPRLCLRNHTVSTAR